MAIRTKAYFLRRPSTIRDLMKPHISQSENYCNVVRRVYLNQLDFENFANDLLVERDFIEFYADLCGEKDGDMNCLFITPCGYDDGILVVPDENGFVKKAAFTDIGAA